MLECVATTAAPHEPRIRLGCIADDFRGATDLTNNFALAGRRVVQAIGVTAASAGFDAFSSARCPCR